MAEHLIYQTHPVVTFATNTFIDTPIILQYEDTPLVEVVREQSLGYTTQIPIYHSDGTYLAKTNGTRIYATKEGEQAGLVIRELSDAWVCEMDRRIVFEVLHQPGDAFRLRAELYTPDGYFVKYGDDPRPMKFLAEDGKPLQINGVIMSHNTITGSAIGVLLGKDGSIALDVNSV